MSEDGLIGLAALAQIGETPASMAQQIREDEATIARWRETLRRGEAADEAGLRAAIVQLEVNVGNRLECLAALQAIDRGTFWAPEKEDI